MRAIAARIPGLQQAASDLRRWAAGETNPEERAKLGRLASWYERKLGQERDKEATSLVADAIEKAKREARDSPPWP
jgi:hypothetical protein